MSSLMDEWSLCRCCECLRCCGRREPRPRSVWLGHPEKRDQRYPRNVINNQKYNFFTFLPGVSMTKLLFIVPPYCFPQFSVVLQ